jgi:phage tail protein X
MKARLIPAARATVTVEDATVDLVCFDHAFRALGDAKAAGRLDGYVEAVLEANPGLADLGLVLPLGTVIELPEFAIEEQAAAATGRLWEAE